MSILIIAEHNNHTLHANTRNTLTAALSLDDNEIICLIVGNQCQEVANQSATLPGISQVWLCEDARYEHPTAEQITDIVCNQSRSFDYILTSSSTFGKNILPRIAAKLDVAQISDVSGILNKDTFEHTIYAGNALEIVKVLDSIKVLSIRTTAFDATTDTQSPCPISLLPPKDTPKSPRFISHQLSKSERPDLGSAKIIVSGGRGLQDAEKFKLIHQLADVLGAAVGASRAAVDAGYVPNDHQVGQTGRIVAPTLYIAVGISGAIQHLAGMKDSKIIVAINKDADAPIFQIATYGLVGDLFDLIPELIDKLSHQ